jgi:hypothetical protein
MTVMRWLNGRLVMRLSDNGPWFDYKQTPYYLPDYDIQGGSPGYRTMQNALSKGVKYAPLENQKID